MPCLTKLPNRKGLRSSVGNDRRVARSSAAVKGTLGHTEGIAALGGVKCTVRGRKGRKVMCSLNEGWGGWPLYKASTPHLTMYSTRPYQAYQWLNLTHPLSLS